MMQKCSIIFGRLSVGRGPRYTSKVKNRNEKKGDFTHLTRRGHAQLANMLAPVVTNLLGWYKLSLHLNSSPMLPCRRLCTWQLWHSLIRSTFPCALSRDIERYDGLYPPEWSESRFGDKHYAQATAYCDTSILKWRFANTNQKLTNPISCGIILTELFVLQNVCKT